MATRDEVLRAIRNADAVGDSAAVRKLGAFLQSMPVSMDDKAQAQQAVDRMKYDPTADMSTTKRTLAGVGKAFADMGRGAGQLVRKVMPDAAADAIGLPTQSDIDEAKALDKSLMATTAGSVGNVIGNVAAAIPSVLVPGAQTLGGAAVMGTAQGFLQPVASDDSRLKNTMLGGAAGAGGVAAGRALIAGAKGAKALVEPFSEGGRQAIAGRTLQRFGVEAGDVTGVTGAPTVTGSRQTLAEQIKRPEAAAGAARLQDSVRALDPQIAGRFAAQEVDNNASRVGALRGLTGEDGLRAFAQAERAGTSGPIYQDAFNVDIGARLTPQLERQMKTLMRAPAIRDASQAARANAANAGSNVGPVNGSGSVEGLHNVKLALDDAIAAARGGNGSAAQEVKARGLEQSRTRLLSFIEQVSPEYATARTVHAQMSRPLNQMDTAAEILRRGTSATSDLAGNPRLMPNQLAQALRDEPALIKRATGRDVGRSLSDLLEPDQLAIVRGVAGETDRAAAVARAANGPGSATAQRMASQNVLRQLLGPTGLPESWAESTMLNTLLRPVQFAYNGVAEPKIQQVLADLLLNPAKAQAAMRAAQTSPQSLPPAVRAALPYLAQAGRASTPSVALSMSGER